MTDPHADERYQCLECGYVFASDTWPCECPACGYYHCGDFDCCHGKGIVEVDNDE